MIISERAIKELVKTTLPDTQITKAALGFIQASTESYIEMLISEAERQRGLQNIKLKVCNVPQQKRLNISHFYNAEIKILGGEGKNA